VKAWLEAHGHQNVEIKEGRVGQFDIFVDDRLAYSRHQTGRLPSDAELEALGG